MADIFISYASEDRSRAETIAKTLEEQGWSVWWDKTILPGKKFDQVIQEAIEAARCVVVLWSKKSINSDWVKEEASIGNKRKILVPANIDPVELPLGFGRIQAADLTNWDSEKEHPGFIHLRNAISEVAGPPTERDKSVQDTKLPESNLKNQFKAKPKENETFQPDTSHLKPVEKETPIAGPKAPRKKRLILGIGAVSLIIVLIVIVLIVFLNKPPNPAKIQSYKSDKYLAVAGGNVKDNANVVLFSDGGQDKIWELEHVEASCYKIRSDCNDKKSKMYLAVAGGNVKDNANVVLFSDEGQDDIVWCLKEASLP